MIAGEIMSSVENKVTIIVPVYKIKEDYLRNCIESLLNQGRTDYEVILVDDGSPDDCGAICDEYANDSRVRVIHQDNQGVSVARNNAIRATNTKWLTFVDADDWIEPNYIEEIYKAINGDANQADVMMFEYSREFKGNNSYETLLDYDGYLNDDQVKNVRRSTFYKLLVNGKPNPYTVIAIWDKVYRTGFLKRNDLWFIPEARKGQDRLFNADALNCTDNVYYIHKLLYRYRCWEDSRTNRFDKNITSLTAIEIRSLQQIIDKHDLHEIADDYLKCRICTRLYTCMRLFYFNDSNEIPLKDKIKDVRALVESEPYKTALTTVKKNLLSSQEKIFVFFMQRKMYRVVYVLVKVKSERITLF